MISLPVLIARSCFLHLSFGLEKCYWRGLRQRVVRKRRREFGNCARPRLLGADRMRELG